jgi:hypothetical protein
MRDPTVHLRGVVLPDVGDWRESVCVLAVTWGALLVAATEGLSLVGALSQELVRLTWAAWLMVIGLLVIRRHRLVTAVWTRLTSLSNSERAVLVGLMCIVILTGLVAWYAPPNTSDSMAYHMSRVVNWAQHQSVAHYATPTPHQLFQPPWAEFAILQLQLLSGSDRFANFVQWASMLGCLITTSLIARLLGGSVRTQILSAVFVGSLPMGVLQSTSTQNNYVVAFWLSAFALSVIWIWNHKGCPDWRQYALSGGCIGLAMCTKGTSYFFAAAFVVLLVSLHLRRWRLAWLPMLLLAGVVALLLNIGQFTRNQQLYGFPLGPVGEEAGAGYQVSSLQWNGVVSNIVRNVGMHLGTPVAPINDAIFDDISYLHEKLGIWLGSPVTSWPGKAFERSTVELSLHESTAGNLLAMLLLGSSLVLGLTAGIFSRDRRLLAYTLAWASGFVLYSALLRWHPWQTRLDLAWFVLGAPVVAVVLSRRPPPRAWIGVGVVLILCCAPLIIQRSQSVGLRELLLDSGLMLLAVLIIWLALRRPVIQRGIGRLAAAARAPIRRAARGGWAGLSGVLLLAAMPWVLLNETRPLVGPQTVLQVPRERQYFVVLPDLETPLTWAAAEATASGCQRIGLMISQDHWDYPLWVLLHGGHTPSHVRVQYVDVAGPSARLAESGSVCAIISTRELDKPELSTNGQHYARLDNRDVTSVAVFLQD